ncbi:hypothetical protein IT575_10105 [bacterium]|nr:hypothetical protein [bacterium]
MEQIRVEQFRQDLARISNPIARDIVVRLYRIATGLNVDPYSDGYLRQLGGDKHIGYCYWLRAKLKGSGLLRQIVDGPLGMPDLTGALPLLFQPAQKLFGARRLAPMLCQVLRNLEWYLDPVYSRPVLPVSAYIWQGTAVLAALALYTLLIYWLSSTGIPMSSALAPLSLAGPFVGQLAAVSLGGPLSNPFVAGVPANSFRFRVNAVEFFRHAVETLSDAPEPAPGKQPQSAAEHAARDAAAGELAAARRRLERQL